MIAQIKEHCNFFYIFKINSYGLNVNTKAYEYINNFYETIINNPILWFGTEEKLWDSKFLILRTLLYIYEMYNENNKRENILQTIILLKKIRNTYEQK